MQINTLFKVHPVKYYTQQNDEERGLNPFETGN